MLTVLVKKVITVLLKTVVTEPSKRVITGKTQVVITERPKRVIDISSYAHLSTGVDWDCTGHCGSGAMPALSVDGGIYPCIRWLPHTQIDKAGFIVGTAKEGFTHKENFLRVREGAYRSHCSLDEKCRKCEVESACSYCIGGCYSEFGEFNRTTYICEITKLLVKWARRYWDEYNRIEGTEPIDWASEAREKGNRHGILGD